VKQKNQLKGKLNVRLGLVLVTLIGIMLMLGACGNPTATSGPLNSGSPAATRQPPPPLPTGLQPGYSTPRHPGQLGFSYHTALSPDQTLLATTAASESDITIKLWDVATGQVKNTLVGHSGEIGALAFSPDGKILASGGSGRQNQLEEADYTIRLWDTSTGRERAVLKGHTEGISELNFSPDGKTLISIGYDTQIKFWEVATGQEKAILPKKENSQTYAFTPEGRILWLEYIRNPDPKKPDTWQLKDIENDTIVPMPISSSGQYGPRVFAFSPDGKLMAGIWGFQPWSENIIHVWNRTTGQIVATFTGSMRDNLNNLAFSPDSKTLAVGGTFYNPADQMLFFDGELLDNYHITDVPPGAQALVKHWEIASGKQLFSGNLDAPGVREVFFRPDGKLVALVVKNKLARLWEVASGKELVTFEGANANGALTISPDGKILATGDVHGRVHLRQAATGQELTTINAHKEEVMALAFSPDGKTLASASQDKTVKLWNLSGNNLKEMATLGGYRSWVNALSFSPDGKLLATASSDNQVKLWEVATRKERANLKGLPYSVWGLAFSPDGKILAASGKRGYKGNSQISAVQLWETTSGEPSPIQINCDEIAVTALTFSPDGKTLATLADDQSLQLWDSTTGQLKATLQPAKANYSSSWAISEQRGFLAYTPNGQRLVSGNREGTAKLWEIDQAGQSGRLLFDLGLKDPSNLYGLALSPDGGTLVGGYRDGSLKTWELVIAPQAASPTVTPNQALPTATRLANNMPAIKAVNLKPLYNTPMLPGHSTPIKTVVFNPDGKTLFSADKGGTIKRWDLTSRQEIATYNGEGRGAMAFSPDGKLVAGETQTVPHSVGGW
jgi:WD40 repeat protein